MNSSDVARKNEILSRITNAENEQLKILAIRWALENILMSNEPRCVSLEELFAVCDPMPEILKTIHIYDEREQTALIGEVVCLNEQKCSIVCAKIFPYIKNQEQAEYCFKQIIPPTDETRSELLNALVKSAECDGRCLAVLSKIGEAANLLKCVNADNLVAVAKENKAAVDGLLSLIFIAYNRATKKEISWEYVMDIYNRIFPLANAKQKENCKKYAFTLVKSSIANGDIKLDDLGKLGLLLVNFR